MCRVSLLITCCALASATVKNYPTGDIINGHDATPHSAPYIVAFRYNQCEIFCAGSILSESIIVTAAHCLGWTFYAVAGSHNCRDETGATVRQVLPSQTIMHSEYVPGASPYDIGLIKIDPPFEFSAYINKVQLPTADTNPSDEVTLFGWGDIRNIIMPEILQTVDTKVIDDAKCDRQSGMTIYPQRVCTQSDISENSSGPGDSGAPLVQYTEGGETILVGIVSIGPVRGDNTSVPIPRLPTIFIRTWAYIDWINENSRRLMNRY